MVNSVTPPSGYGASGNTYTDDTNPTTGLDNYGYTTRLIPLFSDGVKLVDYAVGRAAAAETSANLAAASAATALTAPGTIATSSSSLTIGTGTIGPFTITTGKTFALGQTVVVASTASPGNQMTGVITAFNSGSGSMTINVPGGATLGSGSFSSWTISLGSLGSSSLPSQGGNSDKFLTTDGVNPKWNTTALALANGGTGGTTQATAQTGLGLVIGTHVQAYDAGLQSIAGLTTAADKMIYATASDTYATTTLTTYGRSLIDDVDAAAARTTLGAQAGHANLTALAGLSLAADRLPYGNGAGTLSLATFSAFARTLLDDADAATARETLGAVASASLTGMVAPFAMNTPPSGWLECDGSSVLRTTYPALFAAIGTTWGSVDGTHFTLPDLRGEFVRGWDNGKGTDTGRAFASFQADELKAHTHTTPTNQTNMNSTGGTTTGGFTGSGTATGSTGGAETRPRNFALMYCIKT